MYREALFNIAKQQVSVEHFCARQGTGGILRSKKTPADLMMKMTTVFKIGNKNLEAVQIAET